MPEYFWEYTSSLAVLPSVITWSSNSSGAKMSAPSSSSWTFFLPSSNVLIFSKVTTFAMASFPASCSKYVFTASDEVAAV